MSEQERPNERVIERIRMILTKTEAAGCTPAEAEAAFQMATRLLAEHNLSMADVVVQGAAPAWAEEEALKTGKWTIELNYASNIASEFCYTKSFFATRTSYGQGRAKTVKTLKFFGTPTNAESAKFMFTALVDAFDRLFLEYRKRTKCAASERRYFVAGVSHGFTEKMREERKLLEIERDLLSGKHSGSTAIVLASAKDRAVQAFSQKYTNCKNSKTNYAPLRGSESTLAAGIQAGRTLNLHRGLESNKHQPAAKALPA